MNNGDPLAQLRDIHLPEPVSWWPPAIGWWLLAVVLLALIGLTGYFVRRYLQRNRYRQEALLELRRLNENRAIHSATDILEQIAILMRRVAIHCYGREEVAPLVGKSWLRFLDSKGNTDQFTTGPGKILEDGLYRQTPEIDLEQLFPLIENWIRGKRQC